LIYPPELEVKETTYTASSASFLIITPGPCITNELRDVNTICRRSWYIAGKVMLSIILDLQNFFH
jgi:anthranilate/para-aminobenzoate synthase component II